MADQYLAEAQQSGGEIPRELAQRAVDTARAASDAAFDRSSMSILVDHLRPAQEETLAEARKLGSVIGSIRDAVDADRHLLLKASDEVRAVSLLGRLVVRYAAIRSARPCLAHVVGEPQHDDGSFGELRFAPRAWGAQWKSRKQLGLQPGPSWRDRSHARLLWLAEHPEYGPWLPTPFEQDAALAAHLREVSPAGTMEGSVGGLRTPWYHNPPFVDAPPLQPKPSGRRRWSPADAAGE